MALKTNYKDDVLDTSVNEKRVYNIIGEDGEALYSNVTLEDVTTYLQKGDSFGANEINTHNTIANFSLQVVSFDSSTGTLVTTSEILPDGNKEEY